MLIFHPDLFDIRRGAEYVKLTTDGLYYHVVRGHVGSIRLGREYLMTRDQLNAFLMAKQNGAFKVGRPRKTEAK
jgi:hypothetical protein